uniref:Uncharacterized protein n=1 Tax=Panagrolaimus davidi TaxID=227884 RepID=A0A914PH75_9BILA
MKDSSASVAEKQMNLGKITWKDGTSKKQFWPFKTSIIHYMEKNPSTAKCYLKMAQSCKYFFEANPIIIVPKLMNDFRDKSITYFCQNNGNECEKKERKCCIKIDLNKFLHKLWITERLEIDVQAYLPLIRTKIYRCEVTVFGDVEITFSFNENISADYKNQLDALIDEIIESEVPGRFIEYGGQDEKKLEIMNSRLKSNSDEEDIDDA